LRQHVTRTRRLGPSTQRPESLSKRRDVDAIRKLATLVPVPAVWRISGAVRALPTIVTVVSNMSISS
jgi:hypothetical protein